MKLCLGVIEVPYVDTSYEKPTKREEKKGFRRGKAKAGDVKAPKPQSGVTTGDVASILEEEYGVMQAFYFTVGGEAIAKAIEHSVAGAIDNLLTTGIATSIVPEFQAMSEIEETFKIFISEEYMNGVKPNVPTKAALKGVNHRLKHPYAKTNPQRPSFIDTGLYETNFHAWIEE